MAATLAANSMSNQFAKRLLELCPLPPPIVGGDVLLGKRAGQDLEGSRRDRKKKKKKRRGTLVGYVRGYVGG